LLCLNTSFFLVVGAFVVIEVLEKLRNQREQRFQQKPSQACSVPQVSSTSAIIAAVQHCVTSLSTLARTALLVACSAAYFQLRSRLHGSRAVYRWTIMENHVHHLPKLYERALSYAQYHYLYLWKLLYPVELCFDYGYACVPTVHTLADPLNLRPLLAYSALLLLILYALLRVRINLLLGLMLLLVPLTPALNIVMPVGALVAERLLFIPSAGFCIIVAELLTVDVWCLQGNIQCDTPLSASRSEKVTHGAPSAVDTSESVEMYKADHQGSGSVESAVSPLKKRVSFENAESASKSQRKAKSGAKRTPLSSPTSTREGGRSTPSEGQVCVDGVKPTRGESFAKKWLPWCVVLPVLVWCGRRVVLRNEDWRDEYSLYKSGLDVCPRSLKVLTNYALLAMARQQYDAGLSAALAAVEIYPEQVAALVNAGVAYQKLGQYANSVDMFQRCLAVNPAMAKAEGYMGVSYYYWASVQSAPIAAKLLREEALKHFNAAVEAGFQAPLILHLTGTTLLELKRPEDSAVYYEAALQQSANYASYYQQKGVPILLEDDIDPVSALNQLGSVYWSLRDADKAIDAFERGLRIAPQSIPLLTNLGNIYRERGDTQRAREMMRLGIQYSAGSVPPALYNNLGLLELNAGNFRDALGLFEQALAAHVRDIQVMGSGEGNSVGADGGGAEAVIRGNIQRALGGLQN
jgi:tetratricopeptide (TPR) repeat protein